ncbi:hypothetical protein Nepgr_024718 [Nepenthes gracilis]|uniref:Uncharacterized protein n=1 Tax=Nepenthes gracilis TaxID=150966 RepID=A0AAD3Y0C0_NEPGR|nr:hypothetical protein Nepgr_024718 [Nepenthes gracilis]
MKNISGLCKLPYAVDIDIEQYLIPPGEKSARLSRPDPGATLGESSVGPVALVCLDAPATVDISPIKALGLADKHLNPCWLSPELEVDVQRVVLLSKNEAEKSIASTRDVLGNPMHDSAQVEEVHKIRPSSAEISTIGVDLDLTPNSITNFSCKYPRDASNMAEEVVDDENDFHDPTLNALKKLLEANATETYLNSLNPKGRQTVHDFIETFLLATTEKTRDEFKSSSP